MPGFSAAGEVSQVGKLLSSRLVNSGAHSSTRRASLSKSAEIAHRSLRLGGPNSVLGPRLVQKDGIAYDRERMAANLWEQRRFPDVSPVGTTQLLRLVSKIQTCGMGQMQFARLVSLPCARGTMDRADAIVEAHGRRAATGISIGASDRCSRVLSSAVVLGRCTQAKVPNKATAQSSLCGRFVS